MMWPIILLSEKNITETLISAIQATAQSFLANYQETAAGMGKIWILNDSFFWEMVLYLVSLKKSC
jgi:hypothetical protein